jgi:hypothetical protein
MASQRQRQAVETGDRARWFRVGMVSATAAAPLITRWRSLRAAERARELWEAGQARGRLAWPPTRAAAPAPEPPRANVRPGLWLAGAGVGLVAAGVVAFVVARRRMQTQEEPPLELPLTGLNGREHPAEERSRDPIAAATGARSAAAEQPVPASAAPTAAWNADEADTEPDERAPIIGDVQTLTFYEAGALNLPAETDRIYFSSAQQALAAGFEPEETDD